MGPRRQVYSFHFGNFARNESTKENIKIYILNKNEVPTKYNFMRSNQIPLKIINKLFPADRIIVHVYINKTVLMVRHINIQTQ